MKKLFILLIAALLLCATLAGCNQQLMDTTWKFDYAYISLPNGECVEGKVQSWADFENSDEVQIVIDGCTYLTHYSRVVMVAK